MKRLLLVLLGAGLIHIPLLAQDSTLAAAIAEKHAAEERYKRMAADVESLLAANLALQRKISALDAELQKMREEQARAARDNSTAEGVRKLAEAIQEVDRKRESDRQRILEDVEKIVSKAVATTPVRPTPTPKPPSGGPAPGPEKGYPYTIQSGDTLLAIMADFNAQFKSKGMKTITMRQVEAANPNVDWNRLKIGQKIFIPAPE